MRKTKVYHINKQVHNEMTALQLAISEGFKPHSWTNLTEQAIAYLKELSFKVKEVK